MTWVGAVLVVGAALAAVLGPYLMPFDPAAQELALRLTGPSATHWFGLDELGRDILARVLLGARVSWIVGLIVVGVSSVIGATMGSIAGYFGGRVDDVISRVMDVLMAFPGLLLAIALVAALGPSLTNVVVALTLIGWVSYARLVRGQVLRAREFEYVQAARALGATTPRLLVRHIVPTALPALSVQATLGMGGAILAEASLSFLGLGVQPPDAQLGDDARLRPRARARRAAPDHLSGHRDRGAGAGVQFPRRRIAGCSRPVQQVADRLGDLKAEGQKAEG